MARKARVEFEGTIYMTSWIAGDRGEATFGDRHPGVPKTKATWERMSEWSIL
jgi:hypothetical protein